MPLQHIDVGGTRLAVQVLPHADRARPWLLFAHALASDHRMWAPQLAAFTPDYALAALDLRGHGASDAPSGDYPLDRLADDAIAVMDALAIDRAHVVGLSLGGMVAQAMALRAPGRLRSLTLADTTSRQPAGARAVWDARLATVRAQGMAALVAPTLERWFTPAFHARAPQEVARMGALIAATPPAGYIGCAYAVANIDLTDALAKIDLPALVIVGRDDAGTPPSMAEAIARAIRGSTLRVLDHAAHLSNIEQAERFNAALREFLLRVDR